MIWQIRWPLGDLYPLVAQYRDGNMVFCDEGHLLECACAEDLQEFMDAVATALGESSQTKLRVFKKPEENDVGADTPVRLCYIGEQLPDHAIQWTSHGPNTVTEDERAADGANNLTS